MRSFVLPEKPSGLTKPESQRPFLSHKANNDTSNEPPIRAADCPRRPAQEDGALVRLKEVVMLLPLPAGNTKARKKPKRMPRKRPRADVAPLELLHGADNHDPSVYDVILEYPSGLSERFAFGRRTYRKDHRYARQIDPFEDFLSTIYFVLERNLERSIGTTGIHAHLCIALREAWKNRANWTTDGGIQTLKNSISAINILTGHAGCDPPTSPLSPSFVEHFFDQLHDRVIADNCTELLHRSSAKSTENVYGELRPRFLSRIFKHVQLDKNSIYLDLGSGVGQTAMQASLETQCEAHGIERERRVHALAEYQLLQFWARAELYDLRTGDVVLRQGDFLASQYVRDLLPVVDLVLLNNLKLDAVTDLRVCQMLEAYLKDGAKVVSTRNLKPLKRGECAATIQMVDGWVVERLRYEAASVSWTDAEGEFFVSTRVRG